MLQTFYNNFGFIGSLAIAYASFLFIIFWISGIAGISDSENGRSKNIKLILAAIFPPYPFFWILHDMYIQHQLMKEKR